MEKLTSKIELFYLLNTFDNVFSPSLSDDSIDLIEYSEKLEGNTTTYVSRINNKVVGFISFYANDNQEENSFIALLAVLPEYHGKNIAQDLLRICIQDSVKANKKGIKLEVQKNNLSAIRFYKKNNFEMTEETSKGSFFMVRRF